MTGLPLIPGDAAFPNAESASRHSSPVDPRPYDPGMLGLPHILTLHLVLEFFYEGTTRPLEF